MPKYKVSGTIEYNFTQHLEADSIEEAEESAYTMALDGYGLDLPTGDVEIYSTEEIDVTKF